MNKVFMFSGQGSQYVGMCQELYNEYPVVKEMFNKATEILGYDTADIMFNNEEKLNDTLYTQPLMFVMYASILEVLKQNNITSTHTIGLSLGEYGALYDAGCFDFETGLNILVKRGLYMQEACNEVSGSMSAILGMDADNILKIIENTSGYVKIANYNTYGQLVISGEKNAVLEVNDKALENGAKRAIVLNTSGPFHTKLMNGASEKFSEYLNSLDMKEPTKKLLINTTGDYYQNNLKDVMVSQITNSVMFYQMIEKLLEEGLDTFIEIGPKKTLCSFVKKINRKVKMLNVEDLKSLQTTIEKLEE